MKTMSASDANRHFSALLRLVEEGETVTILSRGRPVAVMAPSKLDTAQRSLARERLLLRLKAQNRSDLDAWSRDDLYDV